MQEAILKVIEERERFDVDIYQKTSAEKLLITRYMEREVDLDSSELCINGIGKFNLEQNSIELDALGMIVINQPLNGAEKIVIM